MFKVLKKIFLFIIITVTFLGLWIGLSLWFFTEVNNHFVDKDAIQKFISRDAEDAESLARKIDPSVRILTQKDIPEIVNAAYDEIIIRYFSGVKFDETNPMQKGIKVGLDAYNKSMAESFFKIVDEGMNAAAVNGVGIILPKKINRSIVIHELGHLLQTREELAATNFWNAFTGKLYESEKLAWELGEKKYGAVDPKVKETALSSYKNIQWFALGSMALAFWLIPLYVLIVIKLARSVLKLIRYVEVLRVKKAYGL